MNKCNKTTLRKVNNAIGFFLALSINYTLALAVTYIPVNTLSVSITVISYLILIILLVVKYILNSV